MMWRVAVFLIGVTSFLASSVSGECDMTRSQECGLSLSRINPTSIFSAAGADIVTTCQAVKNTTSCLSRFSSCGPDLQKYLDVIRTITATIGLICKDDKSITRFEQTFACYQENFRYIRKCYELSDGTEPEDVFTENHCKLEETWSRCFVNRIGERCDKNSKDFVEEMFGEMERWLNKHCNPKISIVPKKINNGFRIHPQLWMMLCSFVIPSVVKYVSSF